MSRATIARPKRSSRKTGTSKGQIRTFRQAVNYLNSLTDYERAPASKYNTKNFSLSRINRILSALGNPHRKFRSVHIAGTKGKGSTAAMLNAMVRANGYKVGLYTSPHILNVRERIVVNDKMISEAEFARSVAAVAAVTAKAKVPSPTYFEVLTAVAFKYFADQEVDLAIVEVGMGGRLDCTNVLKPEAIGITSISIDHMAQLGRTLPDIAKEKAGVLKKGVPVYSAPQAEEVKQVLADCAAEMNAPLKFSNEGVDFSYRFEFSRAAGRHARICITTPNSRFEHLQVPLYGAHQADNCCLALNLLDALKERGFEIDDQEAMAGLNRVELPGRMQMISEEPRILVDGAHNAASIDALMRAIGQHIPYDSMVVIFGCQKDKDIPGMLRRLQVGADKMIFTTTGSPRSAEPEELAAAYTEHSGKMAQVAGSLDEAMSIATRAISREDLICITGSFYLVAEAIRKYSNPSS
ncbi:MAG: bifunctional folylpolyglutamate synthase/dihydrofolate synthase [Planctomycetota bacterium]|nr:MAG: bifunctional folylpolyglutamate synthase/dihydrofolate synthase [Planctomycetota bacterium]